MRKGIVLALCLATLAVGCWLFQPQDVELGPASTAAVTEKVGDLLSASQEELRRAVREVVKAEVEKVTVSPEGKVGVTLTAPAEEAAGKVASIALEQVTRDPMPPGWIAAAGRGLLAVFGVFAARRNMKGGIA